MRHRGSSAARSNALDQARCTGTRWWFATVLVLALATGCSAPGEQPAAPPAAATSAEATSAPGTVIGTALPASGGFASVVIAEFDAADSLPVPNEPVIMDQIAMTFVPEVLVVRRGQPVEFRNSDEALHNVHVVDLASGASVANVASPPLGDAHQTIFDRSGAYEVQCNIHPAMGAFILVTTSPYATVAEADGSFALAGVPHGSYTLRIWNLDASLQSRLSVSVTSAVTHVDLAAIR